MEDSSQLKAAILTVGDELTCGYRLDTNSRTISRRLVTVPLDVVLHLTVGDIAEDIHRGLDAALDVADVTIVTGGLGPTEDDLTRHTIADYFGLDLVENTEALVRLKERFARYGRQMSPSNRKQALIPEGGQIIHNDRGTAPGFYLQEDGKHLFVTPGIPYEMIGMLDAFILPRLRALAGGGRVVRRADLKVYGLPESEINERIQPMLRRGRNPVLGLLPHRGTITIELVARADIPEEAERLLAQDQDRLRELLGRHVISQDERDLPQVVADLLVDQGLTIATAELGTGGLVAARLTEPEGLGSWFQHSVVLSSRRDAVATFGGGDGMEEDLALGLARAARRRSSVDIGIGTGAVRIPPDSDSQRPYGTIRAAVDLRGRATCRELRFNGDRARIREWAADAVLALTRLWILRVLDLKK